MYYWIWKLCQHHHCFGHARICAGNTSLCTYQVTTARRLLHFALLLQLKQLTDWNLPMELQTHMLTDKYGSGMCAPMTHQCCGEDAHAGRQGDHIARPFLADK